MPNKGFKQPIKGTLVSLFFLGLILFSGNVSVWACDTSAIDSHLSVSQWEDAEVLLRDCEWSPRVFSLRDKLYRGRQEPELLLLNQAMAWKHNFSESAFVPSGPMASEAFNPWCRLAVGIALPSLMTLCFILILLGRYRVAAISGAVALALAFLQYRVDTVIQTLAIVRTGTGLRAAPELESPVLYEFSKPQVSQITDYDDSWAQVRAQTENSEDITGYISVSALVKVP